MKTILFFIMIFSCSSLFGQETLNNILSTYSNNIKVNNAPYANSCIYDTHYVRVDKRGQFLNVEYGFGWDVEYGYIAINRFKINLSTVTFYTGYWSKRFGRWEHYGKKNQLTIEDKNGIDLFVAGQQGYNKGTNRQLVTTIIFDFGTEPIANRVLNELLLLQETYKVKDPWLLPAIPTDNVNAAESSDSSIASGNNIIPQETKIDREYPRKSKSGEYGE